MPDDRGDDSGASVRIEIRKHAEHGDHVLYDFCADTAAPGRLRLDRATGQVLHLRLCGCPGDPEYHGRRAGRTVWLHWRAGELPAVTRFEKD